jgi:hypothetical protein
MRKCYVIILFISVLTSCLTVSPPSISAQKGKQKRVIPFAVNERPMPSGISLETLVPSTVGTFKREALPEGAKPPTDEDLNVTYSSGANSIFFGFSIPERAADAQEAVKVTRDEAIASKISLKNQQYWVGSDPSFFRIEAFMSWSRGNYFFYAKANSTGALESFMRDFPY